MHKKRIIGVITVRDGWAVQSFAYKRYLPLGKPENLVENLDRWGVDEILIQVIDRSAKGLGPDFDLISKIAKRQISTPLVYAGGIGSEVDAVNVIRAGADRVCIDSMLHLNPSQVHSIVHRLGAQAVIACLPVTLDSAGIPLWYNYHSRSYSEVGFQVSDLLSESLISEVMLVDCQNEGRPKSFDFGLLSAWSDRKTPVILFGGLSDADQLGMALADPRVSAVGIGNFLSYREHAVQKIKEQLAKAPIRLPFYNKTNVV